MSSSSNTLLPKQILNSISYENKQETTKQALESKMAQHELPLQPLQYQYIFKNFSREKSMYLDENVSAPFVRANNYVNELRFVNLASKMPK